MVQMIRRAIPTLIYLAVVLWVCTPPDETKQSRMFWIQQRIKSHRKLAQYHGERVIKLENLYTEVAS